MGSTHLAYSLASTRTHHSYRATITERSSTEDPRADLLQALQALAADQPHPGLTQHHNPPHHHSKIVFALPGQGSEYPGMGIDLYRYHRTFARTLDEVCAAFDNHLEVPLRDVTFTQPDTASAELLRQTAYAQPALFALGVAMHALFVEAGVSPDYLLGDSIGEVAAAYVAGVLSLPDAAVLVAARALPDSLDFDDTAVRLTFAAPSVPILSNLTGEIATSEQLTSAEYWAGHLREPVRFHDSVVHLLTQGECTFVELSSHPVLAPAITEALAGVSDRPQSAVITTLRGHRPDRDTVTAALAQLHNHGHSPSWRMLYPKAGVIALPTYPFQHRSYWVRAACQGSVF